MSDEAKVEWRPGHDWPKHTGHVLIVRDDSVRVGCCYQGEWWEQHESGMEPDVEVSWWADLPCPPELPKP
ncbi:MAG TPA: hypothetical protein VF414_17860 [Thermoanaerobaculia bacterium]